MNKIFFLLCFFMLSFSWAKMASGSSSKMASSETSDMASVPSGNATGGFYPGHDSNGQYISGLNKTLTTISYVLSALLALATLVLLNKSRKLVKTDAKKGRRLFFIGIGLCVLVIVLLASPKLFFQRPSFPGNFDMRAT